MQDEPDFQVKSEKPEALKQIEEQAFKAFSVYKYSAAKVKADLLAQGVDERIADHAVAVGKAKADELHETKLKTNQPEEENKYRMYWIIGGMMALLLLTGFSLRGTGILLLVAFLIWTRFKRYQSVFNFFFRPKK